MAELRIARCICITISGGALDVKKGCPVHAPLRSSDLMQDVKHAAYQAKVEELRRAS